MDADAAASASTTTSTPHPRPRGHARRPNPPRQNRPAEDPGNVGGSTTTEEAGRRPNPRRYRRPAAQSGQHTARTGNEEDRSATQRPRSSGSGNKVDRKPPATEGPAATQTQPQEQFKKRRAQFNPSLTTAEPSSSTSAPEKTSRRPKNNQRNNQRLKEPRADDLTSNLTYALSTPPYPDCPICFSSIHPAQPTWSCSPLVGEGSASCCWTPFHLKCIRSWASKSVKDIEDAYAARGESDKKGEWRCPGCQKRRETVPTGYWCFCGSTSSPPLTRLATPHSCGNPCSRPRRAPHDSHTSDEPACDHPCPLPCHPGPCPPCQVALHMRCHCGKDEMTFKCRQLASIGDTSDVRTCGRICGKNLNCGSHQCQRTCHVGPCSPCQVKITKKCWCGREEREETCGEDDSERFSCGTVCKKLYRCGVHSCERKCHLEHLDTSNAETCPFDPSIFTRCPCGKVELTASSVSSFSSRFRSTHLPRASCTDLIPTCTSRCLKPHPTCSHQCQALCHLDDCPPCEELIQRSCRCGTTRKEIRCSELYDPLTHVEIEVLCDKPCGALRLCGRHQCNRICCPLAGFAASSANKGKGRRRGAVNQGDMELDLASVGGLHECDLVCGKLLSCGNHTCEARDHRGACPPCLRSSFEEMVCHCGRTVLDPPIPCGTVLRCPFPCMRPPPPCGHPKVSHSCHGRVEEHGSGEIEGGESAGCPPCPHLVTKPCACGKKLVPNVRCSTAPEKVRCGGVCAKLMNCGFHHCEKACHPGECGDCTARCGKARKLCHPLNHPCTLPCHAPAACSEAEPCQALITVTCECGRLKQAVHCGRSTLNPNPDSDGVGLNAPKCNNQCALAKRNARLAEALGINPQARDKSAIATYSDELVSLARSDHKFLALVEKTFAEFVHGEKKTQVLPHMPMERRKFVHDLAAVYRLDTQMVDQEPHRSVQLLRRIDTRIPTPTLSSHISSLKPAAPTLVSRLADVNLRSGSPSTTMAGPLLAMPVASRAAVTSRGWGIVPARSGNASPSASGVATTPAATTTLSRGASPLAVNTTHATATHSRAATPSTVPHGVEKQTGPPEPSTPVPDDWEDDPDV